MILCTPDFQNAVYAWLVLPRPTVLIALVVSVWARCLLGFVNQTWPLLFGRVHAECLLDWFSLPKLLNVLSHELIWSGVESSEMCYFSFSPGSGARGSAASSHVAQRQNLLLFWSSQTWCFRRLGVFSPWCCISHGLFQKVTSATVAFDLGPYLEFKCLSLVFILWCH